MKTVGLWGKRAVRRSLVGAAVVAVAASALVGAGVAFADDAAPAAPSSLIVDQKDGVATLYWIGPDFGLTGPADPNVAGYEIWRENSRIGERRRVDGAIKSFFADSTPPRSIARYRVRTFSDENGRIRNRRDYHFSPYTEVIFVPTPKLRAARADSNGAVTITWSPVRGHRSEERREQGYTVSGYKIHRYASPLNANGEPDSTVATTATLQMFTTSATETAFVDREVEAGFYYWYTLRAVATAGAMSSEMRVFEQAVPRPS